MFRRKWLALTFLVTVVAAGFAMNEAAEARRFFIGRPAYGVYYYHNGPPRAFIGPPLRAHSSAWDIGPYGPGYGWPFSGPLGHRIWVD
jgi:hypothetical protein